MQDNGKAIKEHNNNNNNNNFKATEKE